MKSGIFNRTRSTILHNLHFIVGYGMAIMFLPAIINYYSTVYFARAVDQITNMMFGPCLAFIAVYTILMIFSSVVNTGLGYLFQSLKMKINSISRNDILSKVPREALILFEDDKWLARFERIVGLSGVPTDFISNGISFLSQLMNIVFYYIYVYQYIGIRALLFLLVFIPSLLKSVFVSRMMTKARKQMNPVRQLERKRFDLFLDSCVQSEGRIFRSENFVYGKWREVSKELNQMELHNHRRLIALELGMELVMAAVATCLLVYLIKLTGSNNVSIGVVIALIPYIRNITSSADSAMNSLGSFYLTLLEYQEIKDFYAEYLDEGDEEKGNVVQHSDEQKESEVRHLDEQEEDAAAHSGEQAGCLLEVSSLNFTYPGSKREILHDINICIVPGEKVAVVGENGAGKSTLLKILAGFYAVEDGQIRYDGEDINTMSDRERNRKVSFVFQNTLHYPANLRDNLLPGNDEKQDEEEAFEMLRKLDGSLAGLWENDKAIMVSGFRDSKNVSNGQWQKIGIVRALMKRDCKVFFFDEPTAALDPVSEIEAFHFFLEGIGAQTMLIATHRLGLARKADRIIFLNNAVVEGMGTHEELMKNCPKYAQMYESQAIWYQEEFAHVL